MTKPKLLISGAAGNTGRTIVENLLEMKEKIEIVGGIYAEEASHQEAVLEKYEIPTVQLDGLKPESIDAAIQNVHTLVLIPVGHENRVKIGRNFIQSAVNNHVENVILISTFGADNKDYYFAKQFREIEESLEASSIPCWCIVRPTYYSENLLILSPMFREGTLKLDIGTGKFASVTVEDVGEIVKRIVWDLKANHKKVFELTGPSALNGEEMAEIASKALDHPVKFEDVSDDETKKFLKEHHVKEDTARGLIEFYRLVRENRLNVVCTRDFENICHRPPKDLLTFFQKHRDSLRKEK